MRVSHRACPSCGRYNGKVAIDVAAKAQLALSAALKKQRARRQNKVGRCGHSSFNMANRHLSRSVVLQTLFEWDFALSINELGKSGDAIDTLERNAEEFAPAAGDMPFMRDLLKVLLPAKAI